MTLKDWEEKRDRLVGVMLTAYGKASSQSLWTDTAIAALEFLGIPKPIEQVWCSHCSFGELSGWTTITSNGARFIALDEKYCSICSKPRPGTESKPIELPEKFNVQDKDFIWEWSKKINQLIDAVDQLSRRMKP